MYPTPLYPYAGVYITRRISALKSLGQSVDAYALVPKETPLMRKLRTLLGRRANEEVNNTIESDEPSISYAAVKVSMNLLEFALNRLLKERYFIWKASFALTKAIGDKKFDVIHAHWLYPTAAAALKYARSVNTPCIVTSHGSEINRDMKGAFRKECLATLEKADVAEFVSCALRDAAISFGYSGKNAHVLPNGVEPLSQVEKGYEKREEKRGKRVGFVGNLLPVKRADKFPEIFSKILEIYKQRISASESVTESGKGVEFMIIGEGPLLEPLKREMAHLPVTFTGRLPHSQVMEQICTMDVLLLPSRNEGWGCVALEAEICGTIPVGSANGGIPEAIGFKELTVEDTPSFIDDYARRVVDILTGEINVNREELVERASAFTWEKLQEQEIEKYRSISY